MDDEPFRVVSVAWCRAGWPWCGRFAGAIPTVRRCGAILNPAPRKKSPGANDGGLFALKVCDYRFITLTALVWLAVLTRSKYRPAG